MKEAIANSHEGKVIRIVGDKLTSLCENGKEHHHIVARDAKITCEGKACRLSDLKAGTTIRVTTGNDDANRVIEIEAVKLPAAAAVASAQ